jgi:hypothetical protein
MEDLLMATHRHTLVTLVSLIVFSGCNESNDSVLFDKLNNPALRPAAGGGIYEPPCGKNGLKPSEFWSDTAQIAYRDMQNIPLTDGSLTSAGIPVLNAPAGSPLANLLTTYPMAATDLIECALRHGEQIYDPITGQDIYGQWGLAPNWLHDRISHMTDQQEWLTACMLSRLNYLGVSVGILLEGDTPEIQKSDKHDPNFPYNESTVFGNMFNSTQPITGRDPAFFAYVCREHDLAATCTRNGGSGYVNNRICDDVPFLCGLIDIGLCDPLAPGSLGACKSGTTSEYWKCKRDLAFTDYRDIRTVGVQLEYPIDQRYCD